MKKNLCFILFVILFCCCGCGKQGDSASQKEGSQQMLGVNDSCDTQIYRRLCSLIDRSVSDFPDCWADLTKEDPSGKVWTFEFDDEIDAEIYNVDISIKVELLEELSAKYTVYENGEEVDGFEAFTVHKPPDLKALYVDITQDGSKDVVIIGSQDSGGFEATPWTYGYDLKNRERIPIFDSQDISGCLTKKQLAQVKAILEGDGKFKELFPNGKIADDDNGSLGGIPMVDADGNVYFEMPIWGNDFAADVDGNLLLLLTYHADTKEFDVCDIVYKIDSP